MGTVDAITYNLKILFLISAAANSLIFVLIIFCELIFFNIYLNLVFSEQPKTPPSVAQILAIEEPIDGEFFQSIKTLIINPNYLLLLTSYGNFFCLLFCPPLS